MSPATPRRPRGLALFWVLGLASLTASVAGAGWILRSHAGSGPAPAAAPPDTPPPPLVSCIGHVDVESGVSFPYPSQPGRVVELPVREGQPVKAGGLLLRTDDTVARAQVEEAEAGVKAAEAKLAEARNARDDHALLVDQQAKAIEAARHDLAAARHIAARKRELAGVTGGGVAKSEADAADELVKKAQVGVEAEELKLRLVKARARDIDLKIVQAEQDVANKQALARKARFALEECSVKAPVDGTVLRLAMQTGDLLGPQPKVPPMIFCPDTPRVVRAEVEQEWAGRAAVGQIARIQDETSSNGPYWTGKVVRVADWMAHRRSVLPDPSQFLDVRTLECIVAIDPGQPPLRIGQRVRVALYNP
jgi:multidrug resistance efflux pump